MYKYNNDIFLSLSCFVLYKEEGADMRVYVMKKDKKKIGRFHLLVTSSQSNPMMIMKPEVLVSGTLCIALDCCRLILPCHV